MESHQFTNHLINETSPYLRQHAHNPVDWYAWGEEAFAKAKLENKPILLSIGYSACHWCHVMEHESFENEEIARLMNENFVNIKVDREERPDLDQIYMNAVQMLTHHGGWPMTVFLTPDGVPYYGGTYFPPEDRYNMPGFPRVLAGVAEAYRERPDDVSQTAASILAELRRLNSAAESSQVLSLEILNAAFSGIARSFDPINGGFGGAPKFPPAMVLEFLLRTYDRTGKQQALDIVALTVRKMADGGIYDQLGGGFHRYSTDARWLVPHFEKMLYDNALLSRLYVHYYQLTKDESARKVVEGILDYVIREMLSPEGGFYSTQDADSEGHEGKFFVWSYEEVFNLLKDRDAKLFCAYYDITPNGNFEEANILQVTRSVSDVAAAMKVSTEELSDALERGRRKLFEVRQNRIPPATDEKVLTAWNGLMLASFAEAAAALNRPDYLAVARRNAAFLLEKLFQDGYLLRTYKDGQAKLNGYLEDYAFFADGLLLLFETTGELQWLEQALRVTDKMIEEFWDSKDGGFFFTGKHHEELIVRSKDYFDNATPSGNSVAADVLLRLALLTNREDLRRVATNLLSLIADTAARYPSGFGRALCALDFYFGRPKEIAIISDDPVTAAASAGAAGLMQIVWQEYLPNKVVALSTSNDPDAEKLVPLLKDRPLMNRQSTAYVCENYSCRAPVNTSSQLLEVLAARKAVAN